MAKKPSKKHAYHTYALDVISGRCVACRYVIKACERYMSDLQRKDLYFDIDKVDKVLSFIGMLQHYKGASANTPFHLSPWEAFIVANIFGWYWRKSKRRRYIYSYIEVARKQGKTALASALCLYALIADGEAGAEVLLAANSKEQAKIAYDMCRVFAKQLDPKGKYIRDYRNDIFIDATHAQLKVLAADDRTLDGFNASFALIDEYHSAPDSSVRDVVKSSMGMRTNPHLCTITTAGFNRFGPCYALRDTAVEVLHGFKTDDSLFSVIYTIDDGDDWKSPDVWIKSNPNMGVTVTADFLQTQVTGAINTPTEAPGVITKNINVWMDSSITWLPDEVVNSVIHPVRLSEYEDCLCYIGVDLASTADLTAVCYMIVDENGGFNFINRYYLPESALDGKENSYQYKVWRREGALIVTPGNVTDYDYITTDILKMTENVKTVSVCYDPYNATQWAIDAVSRGLPLREYAQNLGNFNRPTKELERLILSKMITIDVNPITRFCFRNVTLKYDHNGNVKPSKESGKNKIDGVIAMIEALGGWFINPSLPMTISRL